MAVSKKKSESIDAQIRSVDKQRKLAEAKFELKRIDLALKTIDSIEASSTGPVVDTDLVNGWYISGSASGGTVTDVGNEVLTEEKHREMLSNAFRFYHTNVHARAIVRGLVKFVIGKGPNLQPKETDPGRKKKCIDAWKGFVKLNRMKIREKEIFTRLFRDGEIFLRKFKDDSNGDIAIRFISPLMVGNPTLSIYKGANNLSFGIETDINDIENVLNYYLRDSDGNLKGIIPALDVMHYKIFSDSDMKRGVSIFMVCAKRIKQYDQWLTDRIILNKVRSAIVLVRKIDSGASNVKTIRDATLSDRVSADKNIAKMFPGGSVLTASKGIDYDLKSANINAADAKDDGRSILLSIAAAVGMPEMMFTANYENANYSSSLIAQNPFVREIEEWQDMASVIYEDLYAAIISSKIEVGEIEEGTSTECSVEFPPMMRDDIEKISKAYEILYKYKAVSKRTWRGKMGLDHELEKGYIEDEEAEDGTDGNPNFNDPTKIFNLPTSPVNQYGAEIKELKEALVNDDMDRISELIDFLGEKMDQYEKQVLQ